MRKVIPRLSRRNITCLRCGAAIRDINHLKRCGECGLVWTQEDNNDPLMMWSDKNWWTSGARIMHRVPRGCLAVFSGEEA